MSARPAGTRACVAVFDLDGTLTRRDTLLPFLAGYLARHPARLARAWRVLPALIEFALAGRDRGRLKGRVIRALMGDAPRAEVDAWAERFVRDLEPKGRFHAAGLAALAAHREAGDHLVLLSASPDLYVPRIGALLGVERTLCTEISWRGDRLEGALRTPNRRGEEKSRCIAWLRAQYPNAPLIAYGNSASDLAHMRLAERAVLVNGSRAARRLARSAGIAVGDWR